MCRWCERSAWREVTVAAHRHGLSDWAARERPSWKLSLVVSASTPLSARPAPADDRAIGEESVADFDARIEAALAPFRDIVERLKDVPGLGSTAVETIIAEIGLDMSLFPTAGHLLSWAGLVPRLDESAGKRRSTRIKKGAPWLKPVLVQCAWAATRKKNSYFQAQFLRLKARHGAKKAAIAFAASILTTVYHMLNDGTCYRDLGPQHFAHRNPAKTVAKLANRIRNLGYHVEIRAAA
jgi:transposase